MQLTVFGATGAIGTLIVDRALAAGHDVTAYVRAPQKLRTHGQRVTVIPGELSDAAEVQRAVHGAGAVINAIGPSLDRKDRDTPLIEGVANIVRAMEVEGVTRYVGMATPSLRDSRDGSSLLGRIVPVMGRTIFPRAYRELLAMSGSVTDSSLNWTIVRFTQPTNGARTGTVRAGFLGTDKIGSRITRADIADFMLDQLTDTRFERAAPAISN